MVWRGNLLGPVVGHFLVNAVNLRRLAGRRGTLLDSRRARPGAKRRAERDGKRFAGRARAHRHREGALPRGAQGLHPHPLDLDRSRLQGRGRCARATSCARQDARGRPHRPSGSTTAGHPLVYAEWLGAPGKPTVLFYGHYDVQPVDPIELWRHPPFEPTVEGDNLVARGATDDKGQSYTHLKAVAAMLAERGALPVNVKFLVEGEEEAGGAGDRRYVSEDGGKRLAGRLRRHLRLVAASRPGQPSLIYGLQGARLHGDQGHRPEPATSTPAPSAARSWNPLNALCHIVDGLRDAETGKILIPGFYDDVRPLEAWEREEFAKLPFDEDGLPHATSASRRCSARRATPPRERTWARPTCDVNGIFGGYMGKGGARPCSPPGAAPRCRCAWCPTRTRRRSPACSPTTCSRSRRPG